MLHIFIYLRICRYILSVIVFQKSNRFHLFQRFFRMKHVKKINNNI